MEEDTQFVMILRSQF